jgi:plastocyanin
MVLLLGSAASAAAEEVTVPVAAFQFSPKELVVPAGTTVTWVNNDPVAHTVTADDQSFNSDLFGRGESWSMTFDAPGVYTYYCIPHGAPGVGMIGSVVVLEAESEMAPPAEEMAPPVEEMAPPVEEMAPPADEPPPGGDNS